ncbi:MAG TPA: glycosyltransferase family 4 protein [Acidobacteriota bacterium]|nr:glycosyltransferase family 4 protein [Acidobacteriota bacterium]
MRIACCSHYFTPEIGAPSARIHENAREWIAMGHAVDVVTCFPNHPAGKLYPGYKPALSMQEDIDGIGVHRIWSYITPNKGLVRKTAGHMSFWLSALLLGKRRLPAPDLVIGTSPTFFAAMAAARLSARYRCPFVMEVRDLWPAVFIDLGIVRNRSLIRMLERWELALYRRATRIVTVTESFRTNLVRRGVPEHKVFTIFNGADVDFWHPFKPPAERRDQLSLKDRFTVLYLGAFGISQALTSVLECARILKDEKDIEFLFVGDGAEKERLSRYAEEAGLGNVRFLAPVPKGKARELYALSDVCLVPLRNIPLFESFIPSKMFEIMAMGRPIVASVSGEAADILNRSGGAIVVPPEGSKAVAEAIRSLYRNGDLRRCMGERGRDFVVAHYSRHSLAVEYARILHDAITDHGRKK